MAARPRYLIHTLSILIITYGPWILYRILPSLICRKGSNTYLPLSLSPTTIPDYRVSRPNQFSLYPPAYHRDTATVSSTQHTLTPAQAHIHTHPDTHIRRTHAHTHRHSMYAHTLRSTVPISLPHPFRLTPPSVGYPRTAPNGLHMREMAASFLRLPCTYILRYSLATHTISLCLVQAKGWGNGRQPHPHPPATGIETDADPPPSLGCCRNSPLTP
ncbi:hypothetical protein BDP55DRAFT_378316 [Colletotrichum godetiae]|uniref:Uncharacterized protein n=1 Tax=Colletotrichum godetiae TaxID=1209918 RepID=A0AAJ0ASX6_9PEZI|nr:uncharacterized protein BDP55DRAFT_378316 [Colletotrichum godetiae]KAK1689774.1 hypothetical protein BDP55DRAFT_378316 [Colletotrichum godetiae]